MNIVPFNNRILIEEISEKQMEGIISVPDFVKDRKHQEKFIHCRILAVSDSSNKVLYNISSDPNNICNYVIDANQWLIGKRCIVESGMIEEVVLDKKKYIFCPINYIVCIIND